MNQYLNQSAQTGRIHDADDWGNNTTVNNLNQQRDSADFGSMQLVPSGFYEDSLGKNYFKEAAKSVQKTVSKASTAVADQAKAAQKAAAEAARATQRKAAEAARATQRAASAAQKAAAEAARATQRKAAEAARATQRAASAAQKQAEASARFAQNQAAAAQKMSRQALKTAGTAVTTGLKTGVKDFKTGAHDLRRGVRAVAQEGKNAAKGLRTDAQYLAKYTKQAGHGIAVDVANIREGVKSGVQFARKEVNNAGDAVGQELKNAASGIVKAPSTLAKGIADVAENAGDSIKSIAKSGERVINSGTDALSEVAFTAGKYAISPFIAAGKLAEKAYDRTGLKKLIEGKKGGGGGGGGGGGDAGPSAEEAAEIDRLNEEGVQSAGEDTEAQKFEEQEHTAEGHVIQNERGDYQASDGEHVQGTSEFDKPSAVAVEEPYARSQTRSEHEGQVYQSSGGSVSPTRFDDESESSSAFPQAEYLNDSNSEFNQASEPHEMMGYYSRQSDLGSMLDDEMMSNQQLIAKCLRRLADMISPEQKLAIAKQKIQLESKQAELFAAKAEIVRENGGIDPYARAHLAPLDTSRAYDDAILNERFDQELLGLNLEGFGRARDFGKSLQRFADSRADSRARSKKRKYPRRDDSMGRVRELGNFLQNLANRRNQIKNNPRKRRELDRVNNELVRKYSLLSGLFGQLGENERASAGSVVSKMVTDQVLGDPALKAKLNALALDAGQKATIAGRKAVGDYVKKNKSILIGAGAGTIFTIGLMAYALLKPRNVKLSVADVKKLSAKAGV